MVTIEHFSRLVREIYDAAVESSNWAVALEGISTSVDATGCALLISGRTRNEITVKSVGADPASMVAYNDDWLNGTYNTYTGYIADDGFARGTTDNNRGTRNNWQSQLSFKCATPPEQGLPPVVGMPKGPSRLTRHLLLLRRRHHRPSKPRQ